MPHFAARLLWHQCRCIKSEMLQPICRCNIFMQALSSVMLSLGFWDGGVRLDPTNALNYAGATSLCGADVLTRVEVNPADTRQVR